MKDISIIIPTKNGHKTLPRLLDMIQRQKGDFSYEILAIDSGSKDRTLRILDNYSIKTIKIPPLSFTHGRARNIGAENSNARLLVFVNQDAIPFDEAWLIELIMPVLNGYSISSYSRQIPYYDSSPDEKVFINMVYQKKAKLIAYDALLKKDMYSFVLFSTVSACINKEIWRRFKFNEEIIACEDQEFAYRLLKAGLKIAYTPSSMIYHCHKYDVMTTFMRYFDVGWGVGAISELSNKISINTFHKMIELTSKTIVACGASKSIDGILHIMAKNVGYICGTNAYMLPKSTLKYLSYTLNRRIN